MKTTSKELILALGTVAIELPVHMASVGASVKQVDFDVTFLGSQRYLV